MIAKAATISHGSNAIRYSVNKDRADIVKTNLLPMTYRRSDVQTNDACAEDVYQREEERQTVYRQCDKN